MYYGAFNVNKYFNEKAFLNLTRSQDPQDALELIEAVDRSETLFKQLYQEPWFTDNVVPDILRTDRLRNFCADMLEA